MFDDQPHPVSEAGLLEAMLEAAERLRPDIHIYGDLGEFWVMRFAREGPFSRNAPLSYNYQRLMFSMEQFTNRS
jgi:hypothetical protein